MFGFQFVLVLIHVEAPFNYEVLSPQEYLPVWLGVLPIPQLERPIVQNLADNSIYLD